MGLGNVGRGSLTILAENGDQIAERLGFRLNVIAVCSRSVKQQKLPAGLRPELVTTDWRELVAHPKVDIVAELIGGTTVAKDVVEGAIAAGKSVVTANKELIALEGAAIWQKAAAKGVGMAMEASVCGGIPIHAVLREGICSDRVQGLYGILNGTCNYILTEIEAHGTAFDAVLAEAQRLGYAEADPSADVDGFDARSKLALLTSLVFGARVAPAAIHTEGIRRIDPIDFRYAKTLGCTIRLICSAKSAEGGVFTSVRPVLVPSHSILASVQGSYNAVYVQGEFGADTFYYGRGAGPNPTGVAVVSDLMRVARDVNADSLGRVSPFSFRELKETTPLPIERQKRPWYLRFRVQDRPGILAALCGVLADHGISIDAVLQLPEEDKKNLPFVITTEASVESAVRDSVEKMAGLDFMAESPLAMPIESGL